MYKGMDIGNGKSKSVIWTTFDNRSKPISEIDHQHLSNIHHFMKYTNPSFYDNDIKMLITCEIDRRFDGRLLPWRPLRRFKKEMDFLRNEGWFVEDDLNLKTLIVIDGELIGEVV